MESEPHVGNIDHKTVDGFGEEWAAFDQAELSAEEQRRIFEDCFPVFPFADLPTDADGFNLGCGAGRWADLMAGRVATLHCINPSEKALAVAQRKLKDRPNVTFHHAGVDDIPFADSSQDLDIRLAYCITFPIRERLCAVASRS